MSKPIRKHLCECNGTGIVRTWNAHEGNAEFEDCMAGCSRPPKPPTDFSAPQGTLAMLKAYNRDFGKNVA